MDLENAYYRVDRRALWQELQMYIGNGALGRAVKSFHENSKARVRVCKEVGRSFDVTVGLRQGCEISPWLFNLFKVGVVREWKARIMNAGVCLNERCRKQCRVSSFLHAEDAVQFADSEECLQRMVN